MVVEGVAAVRLDVALPSRAVRRDRAYLLGILAFYQMFGHLIFGQWSGNLSIAERMLGDKRDFVNLMRQNKAEGWQGPAGPFVYNVLRSDAVDVVYSTMDGYEALGVPYMAHIAPERRW